MSQIDEEKELSETTAEQAGVESVKFVPVAESIRYRKRAQSAEKMAEELAGQLAEAKSEAAKLVEQLDVVQEEQKLMRRLVSEHTNDLETALLVVNARLGGADKADLDGVIEQLKREKPYLFGDSGGGPATIHRTAGVRQRVTSGRTVLESAAKKAATTGNRTDLQEYLKLRRNFV